MVRHKFLLPALALSLVVFGCNNAPSDDTVLTHIKAGLYSEPALKSANVDVAAKDGVVTLSGQVPDDAARQAAEHLASSTPGVKTVVDQLIVGAPVAAIAATPPPPAPAPRPAKPVKSGSRHASEPAAAPAPVVAPSSDPGPLHEHAADAADTRPAAPAPPPPPPPPQPVVVTIPDGTVVSVRTIDSIDSSENSVGQRFRASLDAPIVVGDSVIVPKGLSVYLKLVDASSAGKFKGRSELTVSLDSFTFQNRTYQMASSDVQEKGASRGKRSAEVIGGGAVLGAIIGGLAGGGKGAAIGAAAGGGGGAAVQALTHGQKVKIPSETKLDFTLQDPLTVTYFPKKSSTRSSQSQSSASPDNQQVPPASTDQPPPQ
jgi:hypothetical protein